MQYERVSFGHQHAMAVPRRCIALGPNADGKVGGSAEAWCRNDIIDTIERSSVTAIAVI